MYVDERRHVGEGYALLRECVAQRSPEALAVVQMLAEEDYGDEAYAFERKAPSAYTLCCWGESGLDALVDIATRNPGASNLSLCLSVLGAVAAGAATKPLSYLAGEGQLVEAVRAATDENPALRRSAHVRLTGLLLDLETDTEAVSAVVNQLLLPMNEQDVAAASEVCMALTARWLAVGGPVLGRLQALLEARPHDRRALLRFLEAHPRVLDPAVMTLWHKPQVVRGTRPDFVLRRVDDAYVLVEVEAAGKTLVTGEGTLSEEAERAVRRALRHRSVLLRNLDIVTQHFPEFRDPDCLVVVGTERALSERQRVALAQVNRSRPGLRVAGVDWLLRRGRSVARSVSLRVDSQIGNISETILPVRGGTEGGKRIGEK
jgi:hypothetical protein